MSETKPVYIDNGYALCSNPLCRLGIGKYVQVGCETWIQIDRVPLSAAHGKCPACGADFHFTVSEKKLEHLIAKLVK